MSYIPERNRILIGGDLGTYQVINTNSQKIEQTTRFEVGHINHILTLPNSQLIFATDRGVLKTSSILSVGDKKFEINPIVSKHYFKGKSIQAICHVRDNSIYLVHVNDPKIGIICWKEETNQKLFQISDHQILPIYRISN